MKDEAQSDVVEVKRDGIIVRIRPTEKNHTTYFVLDYRIKGQRKLVWRSSMADARAAAHNAIDKIVDGQTEVLNLKSADAHAYTRARGALEGSNGESRIEKGIDEAVREFADAYRLLAGRTTIGDACRDWLKRNAVELPRITVPAAVEKLKLQVESDGKSSDRKKQIAAQMDAFALNITIEVHQVSPKLVADYLTALPFRERTKRNHRDTVGYFNRWLVMRGYLAKGTDWLEGVQNYSARKVGEISTYSKDEMCRLIAAADKRIMPLIVIGGFAGLRHAEIVRLDWQDIDLEDGFIEVQAQHAKTETRRIVPIKPNLKSFLQPIVKEHGKVLSVVNTTKLLLKAAADTVNEKDGIEALEWKHNALRHTYISARIAECGDVPRVADEAGNSPQVIRTNYLKRIRPAAAAEWFSIQPSKHESEKK